MGLNGLVIATQKIEDLFGTSDVPSTVLAVLTIVNMIRARICVEE